MLPRQPQAPPTAMQPLPDLREKKQVQLQAFKEAIHMCKGRYTGIVSKALAYYSIWGEKKSAREGANS